MIKVFYIGPIPYMFGREVASFSTREEAEAYVSTHVDVTIGN